MEPDPAIEVRDLRVVRGGREVLHRISQSVAPGTVTGLLGPSGATQPLLMLAAVSLAAVVLGPIAAAAALRVQMQ